MKADVWGTPVEQRRYHTGWRRATPSDIRCDGCAHLLWVDDGPARAPAPRCGQQEIYPRAHREALRYAATQVTATCDHAIARTEVRQPTPRQRLRIHERAATDPRLSEQERADHQHQAAALRAELIGGETPPLQETAP